jgi:hypothetical protein
LISKETKSRRQKTKSNIDIASQGFCKLFPEIFFIYNVLQLHLTLI